MGNNDVDIDIGNSSGKKDGTEEEETVIMVGGEDEAPSEEETIIMVGETEVEEPDIPKEKKPVLEQEGADNREMISIDVGDEEEKTEKKPKKDKKAKREGEEKEKPSKEEETPEEVADQEEIPLPKKKKSRAGTAILAILAAVILMSAGVYLVYESPLEPMISAPNNAIAGGLVEVSAEGSVGEIIEYYWEFGDGTNATGKETTHVYSDDGTRTITLTITSEDGRNQKETATITIHPITIILPPERYGESVDYDTEIYMSMTNPSGITSAEFQSEEITLREMYLWMNGTSTSALEPGGNKEDCFLEDKTTTNVSSFQDLQVEGRMLSSSGTGYINGPLDVLESTFSELRQNRTVQSKLSSYGDLHLSVGSVDEDLITQDTLFSYSDPNIDNQRFSVERLRSNRTFTLDDNGLKNLGDVAYSWIVVGADRVLDRPCLILDINIDPDTMEDNGLTDFSMQLWICNDTFFPAKSVISSTQVKDGNTTILRTESTMTNIDQGTTEVQYESGTASFYSSWAEKDTALGTEFSTNWGVLPAHTVSLDLQQSQDAIANDFTADDALALASANTNLNTFLSSHPNAYCTSSRYGKDQLLMGIGQWEWWNMTFMDSGAAIGVNVTYQRSPSTTYSYVEWTPELKNINDKTNITPVLSYEGAQWILRQNSDISDTFSGGRLDLNKGQFGTEENITLPLLSPTAMLFSPGVDYGYVVEYKDGSQSIRAAIDAETGRYIYVWLHEDNLPSLPV